MTIGKLIPLKFERDIRKAGSSAHIPMLRVLVGQKVHIVIPNPDGESFDKIVTYHGASGHVYVKKKHIGKVAEITLVNYPQNLDPEQSST